MFLGSHSNISHPPAPPQCCGCASLGAVLTHRLMHSTQTPVCPQRKMVVQKEGNLNKQHINASVLLLTLLTIAHTETLLVKLYWGHETQYHFN